METTKRCGYWFNWENEAIHMIYREERGKERVNIWIRLQRVQTNLNRKGSEATWAQIDA